MKQAVVCFGPFGGRAVNGSTTVARRLADGTEVCVFETPTAWAALCQIFTAGYLNRYDAVIGLGEGFDHFVSVERMAVRKAVGKDVNGELPPDDLFPSPDHDVLVSRLTWENTWMLPELQARMMLPSGSPGVALNH